MPITLRAYQEDAVSNASNLLASGKRKIIFQLATGGGKTVVFSAITQRYLQRNPGKAVLILVHRTELLRQTRNTLFEGFNIPSQAIVSGMKSVPQAPVYVGMVESVMRRVQKIQNEIGLVIIDEAHEGSFTKLHDRFTTQLIIGFTATPLAASKKKPLKSIYEDIVCGVDIPELIKMGSLCQNITWAPRDIVDRAALSIKGNDFDDAKMAAQFSKPRYVNNTVSAYEKWAKGTKTIIFNVNVEHSKEVYAAFKLKGYNVKHLDGTMSATERTNILQWFKNTPDAILCNIAVLTAGFDEPTIETVMFNKATMSKVLWLQCCGRGARPTEQKSTFTIIDMGGNAITHGDWSDSVNWSEIFHNPAKSKKGGGVAPVKICPQCEAIVPLQTQTCSFCGYEYPAKERQLEEQMGDFVIVTKNINVQELIEKNQFKKEYFTFFEIGRKLAIQAKRTVPEMNNDIADFILDKYHALAKEWCNTNKKRYNTWHKTIARQTLFKHLGEMFKGWEAPADTHDGLPTSKTVHRPSTHTGQMPWTIANIQPVTSL